MLLDDRGTGASQGQWDSWGARTQEDYEEVLDWIRRQPWSDGKVGTTGGSYMGITSLLIAQADERRIAAGKLEAVHAVWADVPMSDAYRDVTFHGGAIDAGFIPLWLGLTSTLSNIPPSTTLADPVGSAPTYAQHLANTFDFAARQMVRLDARRRRGLRRPVLPAALAGRERAHASGSRSPGSAAGGTSSSAASRCSTSSWSTRRAAPVLHDAQLPRRPGRGGVGASSASGRSPRCACAGSTAGSRAPPTRRSTR